jgi:hypothetical protein
MTGVLAGQNGFQGVYGTTDKPSGYGVYGRTTGGASSGVYGYATGSGTTNYGVRGQASGATRNWGGYFIGDGYFSGNVGIGTSTPDIKLYIKQDEVNRAIRIEHHLNTNYWNVGVGLSTYNYRFEYNGTGRGQIDKTTGAYSVISDVSLKDNISGLDDVLDKVKHLAPSTYVFKHDEDAKNQIGFISQNVEEIFPEFVTESDDGIKFVNYAQFSVVAIKAIQELNAKVEALEAEIETLKNNK